VSRTFRIKDAHDDDDDEDEDDDDDVFRLVVLLRRGDPVLNFLLHHARSRCCTFVWTGARRLCGDADGDGGRREECLGGEQGISRAERGC